MTNDPPPSTDVDRDEELPTPPTPPTPPTRSRHRVLRAAAWTVGVAVLLVGLVALALYGALTTERGTRLAWRAAVGVSGGRLSGTLVGGTFAAGVRFAELRWRTGEAGLGAAGVPGAAGGSVAAGKSSAVDGSAAVGASTAADGSFGVGALTAASGSAPAPGSTASDGAAPAAAPSTAGTVDIRIDHLAGRWALTRLPWRFTIYELRAGTIDARLAPPHRTAPLTLPGSLRLPLGLDIRSLSVDTLRIWSGASATEYDRLRLHGRSDGRHHRLSLDGGETPYGALTAQFSIDGVRPFAVAGDAAYAGTLAEEPVQLRAHLSGSLELLLADIKASGIKLAGRAHAEATPFAAVPLKRATLSFAHVNPQAFSARAPSADLLLEAQLVPIPVPNGAPLVVAGPVSIVNGNPGSLEARLLPLVDAHADVRLDVRAADIQNLRVRLVHDATLSGSGTLARGRGRIELQAAGLDLRSVSPYFGSYIRPTALDGPIGISLDGATQTLDFDLTDKRAELGARARVTLERTQIGLSGVRVIAGPGRFELDGTLARDRYKTYDLRAAFTDFDPRRLMASAQTTTQTTTQTSAPGIPSQPQARVTGTLTAAGALSPALATKLRFKLADSVYGGFPLTGSGTVELSGARLLPSDATLSIAGNDIELHGSFGARGDRLRFHVAAPRLDQLGFGLAGTIVADGDLTGSLAHPNATLSYNAANVQLGGNRIGSAKGAALARDGANGALEFAIDAQDIRTGVADFSTFAAHVSGTRAKHVFDAAGKGTVRGRPVALTIAASGGLTDTPAGPRWKGVVTRLANVGMPALELQNPLALEAARDSITLGPTRLALAGARFDLKTFSYDHGALRSAGSVGNVSLGRLLTIREELTGAPPGVRSDLIFAGDWDFALGRTTSGYARIDRVSGDLSADTGPGGLVPLGITKLGARVEASGGQRLGATLHAAASRIGTADASVAVPLTPEPARAGLLGVRSDAPLAGAVAVDLPALKTTGGLFGPSYLLDGRLSLKLTVAGTAAKPAVSGSITGDGLSATFFDQGVQLKNGIIRVAL
ncbi:MAG: translocation and assembly module TamB, partial [Paraburkholderia sp.]|nr:translocation and assembly module TamB [Paraburkholderia sp.]